MRRVEARLNEADFKTLSGTADELGVGIAPFVRLAIAEKVDRHLQLAEMAEIRGHLEQFAAALHSDVAGLRNEFTRVRAQLLEEHSQGLAEARAEVAESLRRNEAATRTFLELLTDAIAAPSPRTTGSPESASRWTPD